MKTAIWSYFMDSQLGTYYTDEKAIYEPVVLYLFVALVYLGSMQ